jgi:hypothetical protein
MEHMGDPGYDLMQIRRFYGVMWLKVGILLQLFMEAFYIKWSYAKKAVYSNCGWETELPDKF